MSGTLAAPYYRPLQPHLNANRKPCRARLGGVDQVSGAVVCTDCGATFDVHANARLVFGGSWDPKPPQRPQVDDPAHLRAAWVGAARLALGTYQAVVEAQRLGVTA